jgi:hypothetical protein
LTRRVWHFEGIDSVKEESPMKELSSNLVYAS